MPADNDKAAYQKPPLSIDAQIKLLSARGLQIADVAYAEHYLRYIGYYRLSAYCKAYQATKPEVEHQFAPGTSIQHLVDLYVFDRQLRVSAIDALERIEVSMRATLTNAISEKHGAHWFMEPKLFIPSFDHGSFINDVREEMDHQNVEGGGSYGFIRHYFKKYSSPPLPPCWMVFETLSFSALSRLYAGLVRQEQIKVADIYGLSAVVLQSWLHSLCYVRNLCAHHARLWNRTFTITPKIARAYAEHLEDNDKFYAQAVIMQVFLRKISTGSLWPTRLLSILKKHPDVDCTKMGFPKKWEENYLWK